MEKWILTEFSITGPLLITPKVYKDDRGFFTERFRTDDFAGMGLPEFIQDNFSRSLPGVLRGIHCQWDQPQGKLVTVSRGQILDVAVDLRAKSPTFGKFLTVVLSGDSPQWFWIPAGFGHGFSVLGQESADVSYKVNANYNSAGETTIAWNDSELSIDWLIKNPLLSPKDQIGMSLSAYKKQPKF